MTQHVLIVLAVYRPDPKQLRAQIASLARQRHRAFSVLFVVADTSSAPLAAAEAGAAGLDFRVVTPEAPLDAVRAFEFGLTKGLMLFPDTAFFALCDQDDIWHPDRLSASLAELRRTGADLVHSDARVVDGDGALLHRSLFRLENRRRAPGLRGLLYRNTITGMTTLFTRRLVEEALPFPPQDGVHFYHDLWLGLMAEALSGTAFLNRALVDYRQHGGNAVGAILQRGAATAGSRRDWLRQHTAAYALAMYLARALVLRLGQTPGNLPRLEPLKPFLGRISFGPRFVRDAVGLLARGKPALAAQALRFAVIAAGRSAWALRRALGLGLDGALSAFDDRAYALSPGRRPLPPMRAAAPEIPRTADWASRAGRRTRLATQVRFDAAEPVLNILVPTLNPTEIFAGIVTAIDIGLGLARHGHAVRFVATDLPIASAAASSNFLRQRGPDVAGRAMLFDATTTMPLPGHPGDRFLATAWWTAHMANTLIRDGGYAERRFHYLIQDFEPNFYAWGTDFAGAMASYELNFTPIFNTSLLRDHFAAQGFGFAKNGGHCLRPAIDIATYSERPRPARGARRRLALYGRPEVDRNMFPLAVAALGRFAEAEGLTARELELVSVGLKHEDILLPGKLRLESLGKVPWADYPDFLTTVDLGLSLMYSPHPSHPPLEMAAAGARVVTNRFGPKDLSAFSPSIHSAAPTAEALTAALRQAWHAPAPAPAARRIDLSPLGATLEETVADLAFELAAQPRTLRRSAA